MHPQADFIEESQLQETVYELPAAEDQDVLTGLLL